MEPLQQRSVSGLGTPTGHDWNWSVELSGLGISVRESDQSERVAAVATDAPGSA